MKRWTFAIFTCLLLISIPGLGQAQDAGVTVTVKITGFKGNEGVALVMLFDNKDNWLRIPKAAQTIRTKITGAAMTLEFKGIKPGNYAVSVVHDENQNNELDMRWLPPKPKEGTAASNDPESKIGPPKWEGATFSVADAAVSVRCSMKYHD